jgi:hypothetical protein
VRSDRTQTSATDAAISRQLIQIAGELCDLSLIAHSWTIDPIVLMSFRSAVDHARSTAWAVQCFRMTEGDVSSVLVRERIRRLVELCELLLTDILSPQAKMDLATQKRLYRALESLCTT